MPPAFRILLVGALTLGCARDEISTYRAPKAAAPAPPVGTELPPPPTGGGLKWTLPKGWSEAAGSGMRFATLKAPVEGKIEISVVVLAGEAGGELANVNRWRGQIGLGPLDAAALETARQRLASKAAPVAVFDFTSDAPPSTRMVAGLLATPDGRTWFLKMMGDAAPVAKAKPDFLRLMESLRLDS